MSSIPEIITGAAARFGDAVAVSDGQIQLSFADVDRRSNRLANALLSLSAEPGGRVALLTPNCVRSVEIDFAIAKAGKVRVPVNTRLTPSERAYILRDSGAETLLFDSSEKDFVASLGDDNGVANLVAIDAPVESALVYDELLDAAADTMPLVELHDDDPSFILYTSGTTGRPKGATATQASRLAATHNMLRHELDVEPGDAMIHAGSMAHGSGSKILAYFLCGARNIPMAKFDGVSFLELVEREHATGTFLVPTMISMLIEARSQCTADVSSLKTVSYGGAPIAPTVLRTAQKLFGNVFVQVYGSCEAPHPVLVLTREDHLDAPGQAARLTSVGRVTSGCEVIVTDDDGNQLGPGERGEMRIRGANVMRGYWQNPTATAEVFVDGWYRTGDVAMYDHDGYFRIVDRQRDMVISGGLNVYPAEVEAALSAHPDVLECAVFGVPDTEWGEAVWATVVRRAGSALTEAELIEHCRSTLAGYKKPRTVQFVDSLPKGATGKILKRALREPHWEGRDRAV